MANETFGPNEERYTKVSVPHESEDKAADAIHAFFAEVGALREKHKVPEVLMVAAAYYEIGGERKATCTAISFGRQELAPDLAAAAHGLYVRPILDRAEELSRKPKRGRNGA